MFDVIREMELVVAFDARADRRQSVALEEGDADGGGHEIDGFEFRFLRRSMM